MSVLIVLFVIGLMIYGMFFIIAKMYPAISYKNEIAIDAPIYFTYQEFNNVDNMPQWLSGFHSIELISGQPNMAGSKYKMVVLNPAGKKLVFTETLTAVEKDREFSFDLESKFFKSVNQLIFLQGGSQRTILLSNVTIEGLTMGQKAVFKIVEKKIRDNTLHDFMKLKNLIEQKYNDQLSTMLHKKP